MYILTNDLQFIVAELTSLPNSLTPQWQSYTASFHEII